MKRTRFGFAVLLVLWMTGIDSGAQTLVQRPSWKAEVNQAFAGFGNSVARAGDVNGDGFDDVIVGAYSFDGDLQNEGGAFVYLGSLEGPSKVPAWRVEGDQAFANLGNSVATAGDVNGDGFDDVIVGANGFDNHLGRAWVYHGSLGGLATSPAWTAAPEGREFGWSVATAGDVNGDGFSDVVVGAINVTNGQPDEGRVYVYHGSASGLAASPAWTAEGNQAYSWFGGSVSTAGDVNGDGYDDVIVGAARWNNGQSDEGRAFLYLGSAAGLETPLAWSAESDQAEAFFGAWVATAGDVNGDGYGDVIVSANTYSNGQNAEGRAYVYQGSAVGLATSPAWTAESDQFVALGGEVSSAGDLDGDGYGDVIIGFYAYDNGQLNEGSIFAYLGSTAGLSTRPAWSAEGNQRNASFGYAVSAAGDVNGDGYGDVIVGAWEFNSGQADEGRALVYLGSDRRRR